MTRRNILDWVHGGNYHGLWGAVVMTIYAGVALGAGFPVPLRGHPLIVVVLAAVIMSWLTAFNVINVHNNFARSVLRVLYALTEPVFRQIRRVIPPISGLDLSPLIVFFAILWLRSYVLPWLVTHYNLY